MPECRGITVHVTDVNGRSLPEWGVQHVNSKHQGRRVSAYIQSTTDAIFQISLQPRIPWYDKYHPYSVDRDSWQGIRKQEGKLEDQEAPPYAFFAAFYLDGRTQPERRAIIYTDPRSHNYNRPDGEVLLTHRMVQLIDGRVIEHGWAFKEKAIELVFDKLNLKGHQDDSDEATLVNALLSSQLSTADKDQDKKKVGQILVEIEKVKLHSSYTYIGPKYRTRFKEGQDNDVDPNELKGDITHKTGFVHKGTLSRREFENMPVVQYRPWDVEEGLYASFLFFYRSRDQLAKFGFPGFPSLRDGARRDRLFLDSTFSNLTPLSISNQAESSSKQTKAKPNPFGDRVQKRKSSLMSADDQIPAGSDTALPPQLRSFSNPGATSKSITTLESSHSRPALKTPFPPSLPRSYPTFNKNQLENFASKHSKIINNDEGDMDVSEPDTESDLESIVGDDEIPTNPNPDEEDENHRKLRERLGQIEIIKRRLDEMEQTFDSRAGSAGHASLTEVARQVEAKAEALGLTHGIGSVKNEIDAEGQARSKRTRSGTA